MNPEQHLSNIKVEQIIASELAIHPACRLVDIYKLMYQAFFGPAHILADTVAVADYIKAETTAMKHPYKPFVQDIGNGKGYYRISLSVLSDALQNDEQLFIRQCDNLAELMRLSCSTTDPPNIINELWIDNKPTILTLFPIGVAEWDEVSALAEKGTIPSHSELFRTTYDPHYRVINSRVYAWASATRPYDLLFKENI